MAGLPKGQTLTDADRLLATILGMIVDDAGNLDPHKVASMLLWVRNQMAVTKGRVDRLEDKVGR